jgi:hypothetical protein
MIETSLFTRLSGFGGLSALVATRIYPMLLPQEPQYPAVTYAFVSGVPVAAMGADTGVTRKRLRVTAWSKTYAEMTSVADQVRLCLERWRGTVGGVVIQDTYVDNDSLDLFDDISRVYYRPLDFILVHQE